MAKKKAVPRKAAPKKARAKKKAGSSQGTSKLAGAKSASSTASPAQVKRLFVAIRQGRIADVRAMLAADPTLVSACAKAPPKKDDGQSPLQVAFKINASDTAAVLLDHGADVNFMETSKLNHWRAPVLHDALRAAAFKARKAPTDSREAFAALLALIQRMLGLGADPNACDSLGNSCLGRLILDLNQRLPYGRSPEPVFDEDAEALFQALISAGADIRRSDRRRSSAWEDTRGKYLERFVR